MGAIIVPDGMYGGAFRVSGITSGGGGGNPFTLVSSTGVAGLNPTLTTGAIDTTGANLLIVGTAYFSTVTTITDSKSNTWTALTAKQVGEPGARLFYSVPTSVGSGHTFSATDGLAIAFGVQAWSGANATPFDVQNGAGSSGATSLQPGSVTPSANNSLLVTVGAITAGTTYLIDSSFVDTYNHNYSSGVNEGIIMSYLKQGTASATNPTVSWSGGSQPAAAVIAVFKS